MGLVVWTEIPYISEHMDNARQQMRKLIEQNYNHPSIVVWGLSNEITMARGGQENHRALPSGIERSLLSYGLYPPHRHDLYIPRADGSSAALHT